MNDRDLDQILIWVRECASGTKIPKSSELENLKHLTFINGETLLHFAAIESLYAEVSFLLKHGWRCDVLNKLGSTPLVDAVQRSDEQMVKLLLEFGADPNFPDKDLNTPLHHAFFDENKQIVDILIKCGSDVNIKNVYGETPMEF